MDRKIESCFNEIQFKNKFNKTKYNDVPEPV